MFVLDTYMNNTSGTYLYGNRAKKGLYDTRKHISFQNREEKYFHYMPPLTERNETERHPLSPVAKKGREERTRGPQEERMNKVGVPPRTAPLAHPHPN